MTRYKLWCYGALLTHSDTGRDRPRTQSGSRGFKQQDTLVDGWILSTTPGQIEGRMEGGDRERGKEERVSESVSDSPTLAHVKNEREVCFSQAQGSRGMCLI